MAPSSKLTTNTVLSRPKPSLEIVPDQRFIIFHGNQYEASPVKLTGRVRLHTPDATSILKPRIELVGKRKITVHLPQVSGRFTGRSTFCEDQQKLGSIESPHKVNAGTIEWPFEFPLSPAMLESVEGLEDSYFIYHLNARVERTAWGAKDILAKEHIRIVRTIGPDIASMPDPQFNSDIWANKVSYTVSIPSRAVVFGTSIAANVELTPLKKGIEFGTVEMRLMEIITKKVESRETMELRTDALTTREVEVAKNFREISEDDKIIVDDVSGNSTMEDEKYKFQAVLSLPKTLNECRQDVDHHTLTIAHRYKVIVNIANPEGHTSQLVCKLPVQLYISPNLPVDEANEVHLGESRLSEAELNASAVAAAPPEYGRHRLDQIYSDIDISGFVSRAGSGPGTPAGMMSQSRRGSQENVLSLNSLADTDPASLDHGQLLRSRLVNLQISSAGQVSRSIGVPTNLSPSGGASPADGRPGRRTPDDHSHHQGSVVQGPASSARNNPATSYFPSLGSRLPAISQRASSDNETPTISSYDLAGLSRVPSYGAALRTPTGSLTPFAEGPPSYIEATSRPPSPGPGQGHARSHTHAHISTPSPVQVNVGASA